MHVLITGGAGFIGTNLASKLASKHQVTVLDNYAAGRLSKRRARWLQERYRIPIVECDVRDIASVLNNPCDAIVHLAAPISVQESIKNPLKYRRNITEATLRVLEESYEHRIKRVVLASTAAVYGNPAIVPIREDFPVDPLTPYASEKTAAENHARTFAKHGLETVILRFFNVYGPGQDAQSPYCGVITNFMDCLVRNQQPVIYGNGEQTRDFVYTSDVAAAIITSLDKPLEPGITLNIGSGSAWTINDLIPLLSACSGKRIKPAHQEHRPGDILHSHADITLAKKYLDWHPRTTPQEGMRKTWEWYASTRRKS